MKITYFTVPAWQNILIENVLGLDLNFNTSSHGRCTVIPSNKLPLLKRMILSNDLYFHCILCTSQNKKIYLKWIPYVTFNHSCPDTTSDALACHLRSAASFAAWRTTSDWIQGGCSFPCRCGQVSVGQSGPLIETRVKEHRWHISLEQPDELEVAGHSLNREHPIEFQDTRILSDDMDIIREVNEVRPINVGESRMAWSWAGHGNPSFTRRESGGRLTIIVTCSTSDGLENNWPFSDPSRSLISFPGHLHDLPAPTCTTA